ncbi:MAG: BMP family ABC transporter substrate-binding protein [Peptococcaceae bacterium]|nr:BMP family ABC transporter substrate-binding protein [Peptococcaceae bacterium]
MFKIDHKYSLKKMMTVSLAILLIISLLSGCSLAEKATGQVPAGDFGPNTPRVGLITGDGGITDPYYKKAWEGLQKAQSEFQIGIGYVKAKNEKDYPSKLEELSQEKCELIITVGPEAGLAAAEAAKKNPKIVYICLDSSLDSPIPSNVLGVSYKIEEAAFLAGILAGKMTKSHVVGFISGDNKEISQQYYYGYKAGLRTSSSGSELMKGIAGTFSDKSRVEKMTVRMIESEADVVFHAAGAAGSGMIKAINQNGKYAIGSDLDQNDLAPKRVITSVIKNNDDVLYELIKKFKENKLVLGKNTVYGLAEKGVGLAETTQNMVPDDVYKKMLQYQENIISKKLKVPTSENEYLDFVDN